MILNFKVICKVIKLKFDFFNFRINIYMTISFHGISFVMISLHVLPSTQQQKGA